MIHPIVRLYPTAQQAAAAIRELQQWSFNDDAIDLIGPGEPPVAGAADDPILHAIMAAYVVKADAKVYAEGVRQGGHLVIIRAPFGTCGIAERILDGHAPSPSGVVAAKDPAAEWDDAAPLSSALKLPTLLDGNSGLSSFLSMPTVVRRARTTCSWLGIPELSGPSSFLSSAIGLGLLSRKAAPLSSLFHIPLLSGKSART